MHTPTTSTAGTASVVAVDSAFLVHNDRTYPTLCRLFDELGVATRDTDMSMSVRCDASGLEYAGARGVGGLFPALRQPGAAALPGDARPRSGRSTAPPRSCCGDEPTTDDRDRCGSSLPAKASRGSSSSTS